MKAWYSLMALFGILVMMVAIIMADGELETILIFVYGLYFAMSSIIERRP
jgi:hypothetical protein